jgi:hypothetical protein
MLNLRRLRSFILVILALLAVFTGVGQAMTTNLTLKGGEEVTYAVNLVAEDRVLIQFSVVVFSAVGEASNTVHSWVVSPDNVTLRDFGEAGQASFSFVCEVEGEYTLHFVNSEPTADKRVALNYEIDHYIFGMPQMLFLALIIVLACVGGVVAFVLLGRNP